MPIFEYKCADCGKKFEQIVRSGDEQNSCPACQSKNVKRLFSGFAVGKNSGCRNTDNCERGGDRHVCNGCCCHEH